MLLRDLIREYIATVDRSAGEFNRLAQRHILPALGAISVELIGVADAYRLHRSLASTPYQANRALAVLSAALRHAERLGLRPVGANPCPLVKRYPERKRRRYMTPAEAQDVVRLLKRSEPLHPRAVLFIYLLLWTGARPDEIKRVKWTDVEGRTLRLRQHKTDRTGEDRVIYLPDQAVALLVNAPREASLIVGRVKVSRLWAALRTEAGCPDLRLYDLRHTFASAALKAGHTLGQIGELLGHRSTATTARYAHLMDDAAHSAAAKTAQTLEEMMST